MTIVINSIPGADDITRVVLDNGITVLARSNFNSASITVSGYLPVGGLFDPADKLGIADFTASALMRGTQQRSTQQIFDVLESAGASLGFDAGTHTTGFDGKALAEDLDLLLGLLAETLLSPAFPEDQIEKLRARLLTGLSLRAESTSARAGMAFDEMVYANHPYGNQEDGSTETIKNISRDDLQQFHQTHYGPKGFVITVVGGVEPESVVASVQKALGGWQNPNQPDPPKLPPVTPMTQRTRQRINIAGKSQSDIILGLAGPARLAPEYVAAALGNNILGKFGMMGRIGDVVREQAGLAYYASSSLSGGLGPGPWYVSAGVNPDNEEEAIELILKELKRFVTEPVSDLELNDSKANFIGRIPLSLESNSGVAGTILHLEKYQLDFDYYRNYADTINAITKDHILLAAQKHIDIDRIAIAIAGPKRK